jgi:DNA-damage-inducible protein J
MTLRENRIPFDIKGSSDPYWNKSNLAYLRKSVAEIEAGHYQAHDLIEDD